MSIFRGQKCSFNQVSQNEPQLLILHLVSQQAKKHNKTEPVTWMPRLLRGGGKTTEKKVRLGLSGVSAAPATQSAPVHTTTVSEAKPQAGSLEGKAV